MQRSDASAQTEHQQQQNRGDRDGEAPAVPVVTRSSVGIGRLCFDCLRKSSVRGLPRIITSERLHLKLLWASAVAAFLAGLLYNLTVLTIAYRRGDIIITERPQLPRPPFPSITVCDASPVPSAAIDLLSISPMEYRRKILARLADNSTSGREQMQGTMLKRELLNPLVYFDHLHRELANMTGHASVVLRDSCHVHTEAGSSQAIGRCSRIRKVRVPGYLSCSTIEPGESNEKVIKVTFHVLLDSEQDPLECKHCIPEHTETMRTGAIIFVHQRDTYPIDVDSGMHVAPGKQDFILLKSKQSVLAQDCTDRHPEFLDFAFYYLKLRSRYSDLLCQSLVRQSVIRRQCRCAATLNLHLLSDEATLPSCAEQVLSDSPRGLDGVKCTMKIDELLRQRDAAAGSALRDDTAGCLKPCHFLEFTTARSASRGVTKNTALEIFKSLVANTSAHRQMQQHLQPYEDALRLKAQNRTEEARQLMEKVDYLEQNFLTVTIWFPDKMSTMVMQQYIVSLESYLSQVGGLLSLFSGITVVCIAELMELLISLCCLISDRRSERSSVA